MADATDTDGHLTVGHPHKEVGPSYDKAEQDHGYEHYTAQGEPSYAEVDDCYSSTGAGRSQHAASGLYLVPVPMVNSYDMPLAAANAYEYERATWFGGKDDHTVPNSSDMSLTTAFNPVYDIGDATVAPVVYDVGSAAATVAGPMYDSNMGLVDAALNPEGNYVEQPAVPGTQCHNLPDRSTAPVYATLSLEGTYGEQPAVPGIQCYDLPDRSTAPANVAAARHTAHVYEVAPRDALLVHEEAHRHPQPH